MSYSGPVNHILNSNLTTPEHNEWHDKIKDKLQSYYKQMCNNSVAGSHHTLKFPRGKAD